MILWSRDLKRSRDKINPLYLHCNSTNDQQIWQDRDFSERAPIQRATWTFDHLIKGHMTFESRGLMRSCCKWKTSISTTTMLMATKFGWMVIYHEGLSPITWHNLSTTWSCKLTRKIKNVTSPLTLDYWIPNMALARWQLAMRGLHL